MTCSPPLAEQSPEQLRAGVYTLLAHLLAGAPDAALLARLRAIAATGAPNDALAMAWVGLKQAAEQAQAEALAAEYHNLFIGLGRGELVPYGSWYQTGFLMEQPLGELRRELAALGYERGDNTCEPEDHAAALCELMALLIMDKVVPLETQQRFFITHVGSWLEAFFKDLEAAQGARFYRAVGRLGYTFMQLEQYYLTMLV
jgi:TorA maturation chaperone TorD